MQVKKRDREREMLASNYDVGTILNAYSSIYIVAMDVEQRRFVEIDKDGKARIYPVHQVLHDPPKLGPSESVILTQPEKP